VVIRGCVALPVTQRGGVAMVRRVVVDAGALATTLRQLMTIRIVGSGRAVVLCVPENGLIAAIRVGIGAETD